MTRDAATVFANHTCSAPAERSDRMRDIVLEHVAHDRALRVLDLGCGTGSLVFRLAESLPSASIVGIDVSAANIAAAERRLTPAMRDRVRVVVADYVSFRDRLFDLIVCDGVLHLIPAVTELLAAKLAADLAPEGTLVCDMPYDGVYNRAFAGVRRLLRTVRSEMTDRAILAAARLLHSRDMSDEALHERVGYMYLPPERMMGAALARSFRNSGLRLTATQTMPSTSVSQLRHNVTVWTRTSTSA